MTTVHRPIHFVHPGNLDTRTGGYIYDRRLVDGLRDRQRQVETVQLADTFPTPASADLAAAEAALAAIPDDAVVVIDGLAFGVMPDIAARHARRLILIALVHHPLCDETGLDAEIADSLFDTERRALTAARHILCTSNATAARLSDFGVGVDRITVIEPGVDPADPAPCDRPDGVTRMVTVGTLIRRKGYDVLIDALARIADMPWRLTIVGSPDRDPETAAMVRTKLTDTGLVDRVALFGELDSPALQTVWTAADLFVFASHFEGYGMVITEAVAHGLPIVSTRAGAVADTAPAEAAMLVPTGQPEALAAALRAVLTDDSLYQRLKSGSLAARDRLRGWGDVATEAEDVVDRMTSGAATGDTESAKGETDS